MKLSSENAESIALTAVVSQEMPVLELTEHLLGVTGKDPARIRELLLRGTLVAGGTRFRWAGWPVSLAEVDTLLESFPDPDPSRAFNAERCNRVVLVTEGGPIGFTPQIASKRGWFARRHFWQALLEECAGVEYVDYVYRERADRYRAALSREAANRVTRQSKLLQHRQLGGRIRNAIVQSVEFYCIRT